MHSIPNWRLSRPTVSLLFCLLFVITARPSLGQTTAIVQVQAEIPRNFKSWSIFIVCNPQWLMPENQDRLTDLFTSFKHFGDVIGEKHAAVWFWRTRGLSPSEVSSILASGDEVMLAQYIDVPRMSEYCEEYQLEPSKSPYVLVTTTYPEIGAPTGDYSTYAFYDASSNEIAAVLTEIADSLVINGVPKHRNKRFWMALYEGSREVLLAFSEKVTLKINAGPFTAEITEKK